MLDPISMTLFQRFTSGLKIFETYLSSKYNPGDIAASHNVIYVSGVHPNALGRADRTHLKATGWSWCENVAAWEFPL